MHALLAVFYQPGTVFEDIPNRKRAWLVPLLIDCLLVLVISVLVTHYIGLANIVRQQFEAFNMPPEQMEKAMASAVSPAGLYRSYVFSAFGAGIMLAIVSGILTIFSMMTSRQPRYGSMYAMTAVAFFPYWLVTCVMTAFVLLISPDPTSLNAKNLLATNVGAFMDQNSMPKGLYALLTSIDILSFAEIALLAYGFSKLTRVSFFGGLAAVLSMWILYVSCKMAMSLLF